ncbi:S-formylglutathione hydrolase [Colwellia sp. BRX8-7]|jgi:S-formylglutathione hydrolase|uniref:S-formylglutathione hydrolase n=1 Tax=Colwellia sp. BRX8-7 TaxID=2759833 RepID=UPI0015F4DEBF|nr:S-formylglutathione hydrolase [Colwellia sp. BRX8-7]
MLEKISSNKMFGGVQEHFQHHAESLKCPMRFAIYLPEGASKHSPVPVLYWLSGLTCTDENFVQKSGGQRMASALGIAIVCPDTSPRGDDVADDENQSYDLGLGAGFYINATEKPWSTHYKMYDYIVNELPTLIAENFPVSSKKSISGHSMGGHGALTIALKNPDKYCSVSAFSPIANPINSPWGQKAFSAYLGDDKALWQQHDASVLMKASTQHIPALVDQGLADDFLQEQLQPESLISAALSNNYPLILNQHQGYDHSYFFIASFIESHLCFHAKHLGQS